MSTVTAAYLGGQERRTQAVEALWQAVLAVRAGHSPAVHFVDMLPPAAVKKSLITTMLPATTLKGLANHLLPGIQAHGSLETHRPFLGDQLWVLFHAYRWFEPRVLVELVKSYEEDDELRSLPEILDSPSGGGPFLADVLTSDELTEASKRTVGRFAWIVGLLEGKILAAAREHLAGGEGSQLGFEEATRLLVNLSETEGMLLNAQAGGGAS